MSQAINPDLSYGVKTFDLSEARADPGELVQLPNAQSLSFLEVPDECYLRLGKETSPKLDLRDFEGIRLDAATFGQVYLQNPVGAGTLKVFVGIDVEAAPETTISEIEGITSTVNVQEATPLDVSAATVPTEPQTPVGVEDSAGTQVNPATESTLTELTHALASASATDQDSVLVDSNTPLDASAATVTVTDNGAFALSDVEASTATAAAAGTGSANAAQVNVPDGRESVEVMYETSGSATITVEVSTDGATWYERTKFQPSAAANAAQHLDVGADYVRAYIDANLNNLEVSAKGV